MRRLLATTAFLATAATLMATGAMPEGTCAAETVRLQANTTCGPAAAVTLTSTSTCLLTTEGAESAGLPANGRLSARVPDAGILEGFLLEGYAADGGWTTCASITRRSGMTSIQCGTNCWSRATADGGVEGDCPSTCEGNLNP